MTQQHTRAADSGPNMAPPVVVVSKSVTNKFGGTNAVHFAQVEISSPHLLEAGDHLLSPRQVDLIALESYRKGMADADKEAAADLAHETGALRDKINAVYRERNELAIALARLTLLRQGELGRGKGSWAGYGFDDKTGRAVVYVQLPSGHQISWHMDDDTSAMFASTFGVNPLPEFDGQWDGTFIGHEENWAVRHIYSPDVCATGETPAEPEIEHPMGATHYRTCSGGKRRYYKQSPADGEWQYYHADGAMWHPTDLSADYLESHIHRLDCDTQETELADSLLVTIQSMPTASLSPQDLAATKADASAVDALSARVSALESQATALSARVSALESQATALSAVCHAQPQASIQYLASLIAEFPLRKKDTAE